MNDNLKDLENKSLTDDQTEEVAGGSPIFKPFRNATLDDDQLDQVSGGVAWPYAHSEIEKEKESENLRSYNPRHRIDSPTPMA